MSKQTSFAHQREILERFSSLLQGLGREVENINEKYEATVLSLYEEDGLMEEIYLDYKNVYMDPIRKIIDSTITKIKEDHIAFVEKEIDFISSR